MPATFEIGLAGNRYACELLFFSVFFGGVNRIGR